MANNSSNDRLIERLLRMARLDNLEDEHYETLDQAVEALHRCDITRSTRETQAPRAIECRKCGNLTHYCSGCDTELVPAPETSAMCFDCELAKRDGKPACRQHRAPETTAPASNLVTAAQAVLDRAQVMDGASDYVMVHREVIGNLREALRSPAETRADLMQCQVCHGRRRWPDQNHECPNCGGTGRARSPFAESAQKSEAKPPNGSITPICPLCRTELAFQGDVCGLCNPVAQP